MSQSDIEEVRRRLHEAVEHYVHVEAELRALEADQFRVCIFGSARIQPEDETYQTVRRLAQLLGSLGIDVVTGGGPGLMEAASIGAREARHADTHSIGLPIYLPSRQEAANKHLDIKSEHTRFSSRLDEFMRLSHAIIVAPGGIGTLLELAYVWQLIQVALIERRTILLLQSSFWQGLIEWMRGEMLSRGFIADRDLDWVRMVDTPAEAFEIIRLEVERFAQERRSRPEQAETVQRAEDLAVRLDEIMHEPEMQAPLPLMSTGTADGEAKAC